MADQKIPYEYQTDFGQIGNLEEIAKLMELQRQRNQEQMRGQMVSGHFIRMSPMQGLADMFAAYQGGKARRDAARLRTELPARMARDEAAERRGIESVLRGVNPSEMDPEGAPPDYVRAAQMAEGSKFDSLRKSADTYRQINANMMSAMAPRATPESLNTAMAAGGNAGVLRARPDEQWSDPYLAETTPGLPKQLVQRNTRTGEIRQVNRAPSTSVRVDTGKDTEDPYLKAAQAKMADSDVALYQAAAGAHAGNQALTRIEKIIKEQPPTGGPLAFAEVWVRNLAAQFGVPLNEAVDTANAKLTAEFTSRIADQVLTGGRGISNDDAKRLEAAFPSFRTGIPTAQLPAFIAQLKMVNNARISGWNEVYGAMDPKRKSQFPLTFGPQRDVPASGGRSVTPFADPEKERRYQEWKRAQEMGSSPVRGGQ